MCIAPEPCARPAFKAFLRTVQSCFLCVQLTDQKLAMEMLLSTLGITAKTNFIHVKGMFDKMDRDGSGAVDGDELARALSNFTLLSVPLQCM